MSDLSTRWTSLCNAFGGHADAGLLWHALQALYLHPPRAYHSLHHIGACLSVFDQLRTHATHPLLLELALWTHDCIYIPGRSDNEHRSALVAQMFLPSMSNGSSASATAVYSLIDATRHTGAPLTGDCALIADIDLSALAIAPEQFDQNARAIREEFAFASDADFYAGRTRFIESMLNRQTIFHTAVGRQRFEEPSRRNLQRELARLRTAARG